MSKVRNIEFEGEPQLHVPPILEDAAYLRDWMETSPSIAGRLAEALARQPSVGLISAAAAVLRGIEEAKDLAESGRPSLIAEADTTRGTKFEGLEELAQALDLLGFVPIATNRYETLGIEVSEDDYVSPSFTGPDRQIVITEMIQQDNSLSVFAEVRPVQPA